MHIRVRVIHIPYPLSHMLMSLSPQFVPIQTPIRGRAVCAGRETDSQTKQERQVRSGGGREAVDQQPQRDTHNRSRFSHFVACFVVGFIYRRQNGEVKPLTVPKDIDLHLEKAPINVLDALGKTVYMQVENLVLTYNGSKITFSCFCSQCCVFS